jgi:hypothetical protein
MAERITVVAGQQLGKDAEQPVAGFEARTGGLSEFEIDTQMITDEVSKLLRCIDGIQSQPERRFEIAEVQFNLGVSTKGKVSLLAFGAEAGVEAAIKVTIKHRP